MTVKVNWGSDDKAQLNINISGLFLYKDKDSFEAAYRLERPSVGYNIDLSKLNFIPAASIPMLTDLIDYAEQHQLATEFTFQKGYVWNTLCLRGLRKRFKVTIVENQNIDDFM